MPYTSSNQSRTQTYMLTEMTHSEYARAYKRNVAGKYMLVEGNAINEKISGSDFCATRKYDGIMQVIFIESGKATAFNSGGNSTLGTLPCIAEFESLSKAAGISDAIFGAELYATISDNGRERVGDVAQALADEQLHSQLRFALFDVMEVNGEAMHFTHYKDKLAYLRSKFGNGNLVRPVVGKALQSKAELVSLFEKTVLERGNEGLVVHSELPVIYKVKQRHSIDVAVIGYTAGEDTRREMVRDLLCAVVHPDGTLRQVCSVGTGFTDDMRYELYRRLSAIHAESEYIETDSRRVAFQMVRPEVVIEISAIDYVTENAAGEAKQNMLLTYDGDCYEPLGKDTGVVLLNPVYIRERSDKRVSPEDVRLSQLTDLCEFSTSKIRFDRELPLSTMMVRRVFVKHSGLKRMVQKFLVWKTNKEQSGVFSAYVLHHTDYNYSRREQLRHDLRVSDSREQIISLLDNMIESNIKKGWEEVVC